MQNEFLKALAVISRDLAAVKSELQELRQRVDIGEARIIGRLEKLEAPIKQIARDVQNMEPVPF